ncbi:geranylgeranyl pyrophosphate synthetase [Microthyrium microscopicum]|uniref:Geranylgeranyl pyrophosphate synthetase n=1 Tax=Microthyrium microscopicum TaxID=703497 RepID=A0A6A6UF30_9PEZI|nr:geranylgeranyl pyrophosphate synthetase [Microthyrium microscopicum]
MRARSAHPSRITSTIRSHANIQLCAQCRHPSLYITQNRHQSSIASAVKQILTNGTKTEPPISFDPLRSVAKEMKFLTKNIRDLLGSGHPMLDKVAKYYTQSEGKYVRPMLVLLMSRATAIAPKETRSQISPISQRGIDTPFAIPSILNDSNPSASQLLPLTANDGLLYESTDPDAENILPSQRRLAEITELIHTASLLHDDVIDHSTARRGMPSANLAFSNKLAVLAGDFLLGRASVALARLRDPEVTELLATVIANLVEGEFMQLRNTAKDEKRPVWTPETLTYYLQKTYLKSASLISKSCRAAALLGQSSPAVVEAAYAYGKNLGLAFQLVDDMLDYTESGAGLGKPAGADLELGLATAPLLFAWESMPELGTLVGRKFANEGDVEQARTLVLQSSGLEQTRALAQSYVDQAIDAIKDFPPSEAKEGLEEMCTKVMKRRK